MRSLVSWVHAGWKLTRLGAAIAAALLEFLFFPPRDGRHRAEWTHRSGKRLARSLGLKVSHQGAIPEQGLIVSNHVSYLDIVALATTAPMYFVSKADVERWPIFGSLARRAGTVFVRRDRRGDVARVNAEIRSKLAGGHLLTLFPEGTSSDGREVLPFRSSLLEPALGQTVTPVWIHYSIENGSVEHDVAYWGDMVFGPHLLKLLTKGAIHCQIAFGPPFKCPTDEDRKALALRLRAAVRSLREGSTPRSAPPAPVPERLERPGQKTAPAQR